MFQSTTETAAAVAMAAVATIIDSNNPKEGSE